VIIPVIVIRVILPVIDTNTQGDLVRLRVIHLKTERPVTTPVPGNLSWNQARIVGGKQFETQGSFAVDDMILGERKEGVATPCKTIKFTITFKIKQYLLGWLFNTPYVYQTT
jgi:hypothetical protein